MSCWVQPVSFLCAPKEKQPQPPQKQLGPRQSSSCAPRRHTNPQATTTCLGGGRTPSPQPTATSIGSSSHGSDVPFNGSVRGSSAYSDGMTSASRLRAALPSQSPAWIAELAERSGKSPESVQQELRALEAVGQPYSPFADVESQRLDMSESSFNLHIEDPGRDTGAGTWGPNEPIPEGKRQEDVWVLACNMHTNGKRMLGQIAFLSVLLTILTALCLGLVGATDCELTPLNPWVWGLLAGLLELGMMICYCGMLHCALKLQQLHDEKHARKQNHDKAMATETLFYLAIMATPLELQRAKAMLYGTKLACGLLVPQLLWGFLGTISAFSGLSGTGGSACGAPIPLMLVVLIIGALAQPFVQVTNFFEVNRKISK